VKSRYHAPGVHQLRKKYGIESVIAKNDERNQKIASPYEGGASGTALSKNSALCLTDLSYINETKKSGKKSREERRNNFFQAFSRRTKVKKAHEVHGPFFPIVYIEVIHLTLIFIL